MSVTLNSGSRDTFVAAATPAPLTLDGSWQVEFPEGWGAPRITTFEKLQSWTESDNEGIRFFSGIATYRKTFEVPESLAKRSRLFLGGFPGERRGPFTTSFRRS